VAIKYELDDTVHVYRKSNPLKTEFDILMKLKDIPTILKPIKFVEPDQDDFTVKVHENLITDQALRK